MSTPSLPIASASRRLGAAALAIACAALGAVPPGRPASPVRPPMPSGAMQPANRMPARPTAESPAQADASRRPAAVQAPASRSAVNEGTPIRPASNAIIAPRPMARCEARPTPDYWRHRDLQAEIRAMARRGCIAVHPIREDVNEYTGFSEIAAGWIAYGFRVPAGESLHVRLHHPNEGWFRLSMMNKWGNLEQGMLQNLIPTGNPEVKYTNPTQEARSVYVLVDDPGWMSTQGNPFTVTVTRSWDPAKKRIENTPIVTGIWAEKKEEPKPDSAAQATPPANQPKS